MTNTPRLIRKPSGAIIFEHPCNRCGRPAGFGTGVRLRAYLDKAYAGEPRDERLLGVWWCGPNETCKAEASNG
jgi:hypothetical protein